MKHREMRLASIAKNSPSTLNVVHYLKKVVSKMYRVFPELANMHDYFGHLRWTNAYGLGLIMSSYRLWYQIEAVPNCRGALRSP